MISSLTPDGGDLIVLGAGRGAGDIVWLVEAIRRHQPTVRLRGFLDDDAAKQGTRVSGFPVLGPLEAAADFTDVRFVVGVASDRRPGLRLEVGARRGLPRGRFITLVHPGASVSPSVSLGRGCLVFQGAVVGDQASLADHAFVGPGCIVSHHATVGEGATMAPGSILCGGAVLGAAAYAGAGSVVRGETTVGPGALVGMGSVVVRDVPAGRTVLGNPARLAGGVRRGARA